VVVVMKKKPPAPAIKGKARQFMPEQSAANLTIVHLRYNFLRQATRNRPGAQCRLGCAASVLR
jgi:hypothetical protein